MRVHTALPSEAIAPGSSVSPVDGRHLGMPWRTRAIEERLHGIAAGAQGCGTQSSERQVRETVRECCCKALELDALVRIECPQLSLQCPCHLGCRHLLEGLP